MAVNSRVRVGVPALKKEVSVQSPSQGALLCAACTTSHRSLILSSDLVRRGATSSLH